MHARLLPVVALGGVLALSLSACSAGTPDSAPAVVTVDTVAAPSSLSPQSASASIGNDIVGASDDLPWIVGGSLAEPGEAAAPTVWTSSDGTEWTASTVGDAKGWFYGTVAGSESLAALGGTAWNEGRYTSALWTSGDGEKWTAVSLPDEFGDSIRLGDFGVDGDLVFGVGSDAEGASRGLLVDGDDVSLVDLPQPADDELLSPQAVIVTGDTLVLIASPGPEGDPAPTVSYTSDDLGKSWGDAEEIADSRGFVSGVVAVEDGFVATGGASRGDGAVGLAAWFSADGSSWAAESVPAPPEDGPLFTLANADTWLGAPSERDGVVGAVLGNDNASVSGVLARQSGGAWSMVAQTSANSTNGVTGIAMANDGGFVAGIIGADYARMALVQDGWSDTTVLAERQTVANVGEVYPTDEGAQLTLTSSTFTVDADLDWSNQVTSSLAEFADDAVKETAWDPEAAAAWSGIDLVTDDTGAQLVIGSYFDTENQIIPVQGVFRSSADAEWVPLTGFEPGGATSLNGAAKLGDTWVAYGTVRDSSAVADPEHGAVWMSADGVSWTRQSGDFGSGTLESELSGVCALPDGGLIGVGWTEVEEGEFRTTVWSANDGEWTSTDTGDIGASYGFGTSCASDKDGVIIGATLNGRDTLQRSTDGSAWNEVFRADRGISIGEPVAVEGGFAASGSMYGQDYSGPVVWLSTSGTEWAPVAIPSLGSGSTSAVAPIGDDLLVAMSGRIGEPLSVIRDIADVIADKA